MSKILKLSIIVGTFIGIQPVKALPINQELFPHHNQTIKLSTETNYKTGDETVDDLQATSNQDYVNPIPENQDPRIEQIVFDFDNSYDYGTCLDAILLAYENRELELEKASKNQCTEQIFSIFEPKLSKDVALQLIELANYHATQKLQLKLYPSLGLRRRIAINFGYIYDIDRNNNDILKYLSSNQQ